MKKIVGLFLISLATVTALPAQTLQVDTLQYNGDANKFINIVIMGDGYRSAEQVVFRSDAVYLSNYLLGQAPWSNYLNYFNVFAIHVISPESGAKHPGTAGDCGSANPPVPVSNPDNYLGSTFDYYGIHRLVVPVNTSTIVNVLSANFPNYDQVVIIANSPYYGGSGGAYATTTVETSANEIVSHELGHSFADLADEYYAGDFYAAEMANMTQETDPALVRWKNWYGFNGIGIYQHCCGGNSALWYKPHTDCKMQYLGAPYCNVCAQALIESIHTLVNPIVSYTPVSSTVTLPDQFLTFKLTELMKPVPNTLNIKWELDGTVIFTNHDSIQIDQTTLTNGNHTLVVSVIDTTSLLRVDNHSTIHLNTVTWTIKKTVGKLELTAGDNKIIFSLYPNPAAKILNVSINSEKSGKVSIELISLDGKIIRQLPDKKLDAGKNLTTLNIENLQNGTYALVFRTGSYVHTQAFIKQ